MLILSENKLNYYKNYIVNVYTNEPLYNGCECFATSESLDGKYYKSKVSACNIKHNDGKFYYSNEDLSQYADWFQADMLPIIGAFVSSEPMYKYNKKYKCNTLVKQKPSGKLSKSFIVDAASMPAFFNEDITVNDYRYFNTLFHEYTIEQVLYERYKLFDAKFKASKFDLVNKMQNSNFLQSKDFKMINSQRQYKESVYIGYIVKENKDDEIGVDYGYVYIDMNNKLSIIWH